MVCLRYSTCWPTILFRLSRTFLNLPFDDDVVVVVVVVVVVGVVVVVVVVIVVVLKNFAGQRSQSGQPGCRGNERPDYRGLHRGEPITKLDCSTRQWHHHFYTEVQQQTRSWQQWPILYSPVIKVAITASAAEWTLPSRYKNNLSMVLRRTADRRNDSLTCRALSLLLRIGWPSFVIHLQLYFVHSDG